MGGRGGSSGLSASNATKSNPSYFSETEKAVQLKITVYDYDLEERKSRMVWVPKSQLNEEGKPTRWITNQKAQEFYSGWGYERNSSQFSTTWEDSNGKRFEAGMTQKQKEQKAYRDASRKPYYELVQEAKKMGIKGIRVGMKRKTIEEKIKKHKKA